MPTLVDDGAGSVEGLSAVTYRIDHDVDAARSRRRRDAMAPRRPDADRPRRMHFVTVPEGERATTADSLPRAVARSIATATSTLRQRAAGICGAALRHRTGSDVRAPRDHLRTRSAAAPVGHLGRRRHSPPAINSWPGCSARLAPGCEHPRPSRCPSARHRIRVGARRSAAVRDRLRAGVARKAVMARELDIACDAPDRRGASWSNGCATPMPAASSSRCRARRRARHAMARRRDTRVAGAAHRRHRALAADGGHHPAQRRSADRRATGRAAAGFAQGPQRAPDHHRHRPRDVAALVFVSRQ